VLCGLFWAYWPTDNESEGMFTMEETRESSIREAWILCLILGLVMINFPFIHIFNSEQLIFGIPKLVFYFFTGWPISIAVIWIFVHFTQKGSQSNSDTAEDKNES